MRKPKAYTRETAEALARTTWGRVGYSFVESHMVDGSFVAGQAYRHADNDLSDWDVARLSPCWIANDPSIESPA